MDLESSMDTRQAPGASGASTKLQVVACYAAILADVFVTAYTDTMPSASDGLTIILLLSLQIFLLLAIILAFFLLTSSVSPFVGLGLYDRYLRQHRAVFLLALAALLLVGSVGAYRLVLAGQGVTYMQLWDQPGYLALWVVQRTVLLLLQCAAAHATATSLKPQDGDSALLAAAATGLLARVRRF